MKNDTCNDSNAATPTSATQHTCPKCYNNSLQDVSERTGGRGKGRKGFRQKAECEGATSMPPPPPPLMLMLLLLLLPPPLPFPSLQVYNPPT